MSAPNKPHPVTSLSFVIDRAPKSRTNLQRCFWNVASLSNDDELLGLRLGLEYLRFLREDDPDGHGYLGSIVGDMPSELRQVEIGFLHVIDQAVRQGLAAAEGLVAHYQNYRKRRERSGYAAFVNQRPDGSVVIEQPDGTRAVYRKVEAQS
jgi:hypothetical protein